MNAQTKTAPQVGTVEWRDEQIASLKERCRELARNLGSLPLSAPESDAEALRKSLRQAEVDLAYQEGIQWQVKAERRRVWGRR